MNKRLNNRGESLAEILVAVLIAALGILAVAGMIITASNLLTKSEKSMYELYDAQSAIEAQDTTALEVTNGTVTYQIGTSQSESDNVLVYTDSDTGLEAFVKGDGS